ncbi:MAG: bifunctional riboflavin kinase/FAD synthetase [Deltaproteobacteria bacterium]|nr:bifunctional riboflavin kinase/FAD synthetase [Deltaproteobacteria bacterium]
MKVFVAGPGSVSDLRGAVVAVGNFDGLHRGHLALFAAAKKLAAGPVGVVTFDPHPVRVLAPHLAPPLILRNDEKEAGLAKLGIDVLYVVPFDAALAALPPQAFIDDVLVKRLGVSGVVVGAGFRFGEKARGSIEDLRRAFGERAVEIAVVTEGNLVCSSTKIRELVMQGNVDAAGLLLGHAYFVAGEVVSGDARGRTIGIRTANVESRRELLPKVGVYATRAVLADGRVKGSVTNVGLRPTFAGQSGIRIETHIFDLDADLYGQELRLEFIARLRDEQKFANVEALLAQIHLDIAAAKAVLG